jgi:hypothetical protein
MNFEYEKRLEAAVDKELKSLPELKAPSTLMFRVMKAVEARLGLPWYRQSWQMWPLALRTVSFALLLALFGGVCFGTWQLTHLESFAAATHTVGGWFSGFGVIWRATAALLNALVLAVKHLGTGFLIAIFAALALGYALCVGLGTIYLRLGLARR